MDPLSITVACTGLLGAVVKTSTAATGFVRGCREARGDLAAVIKELSELRLVIELLEADTAADHAVMLPQGLQAQLQSLIANCHSVLRRIEAVLDKHKGRMGPAKWQIDGKHAVEGLKGSLQAYRGALGLALETMTLAIVRDTRQDTMAIREDTGDIKQDTAEILQEIARLRALVAREDISSGQEFVMGRYLDNLTSYAETVSGDSEGALWGEPTGDGPLGGSRPLGHSTSGDERAPGVLEPRTMSSSTSPPSTETLPNRRDSASGSCSVDTSQSQTLNDNQSEIHSPQRGRQAITTTRSMWANSPPRPQSSSSPFPEPQPAGSASTGRGDDILTTIKFLSSEPPCELRDLSISQAGNIVVTKCFQKSTDGKRNYFVTVYNSHSGEVLANVQMGVMKGSGSTSLFVVLSEPHTLFAIGLRRFPSMLKVFDWSTGTAVFEWSDRMGTLDFHSVWSRNYIHVAETPLVIPQRHNRRVDLLWPEIGASSGECRMTQTEPFFISAPGNCLPEDPDGGIDRYGSIAFSSCGEWLLLLIVWKCGCRRHRSDDADCHLRDDKRRRWRTASRLTGPDSTSKIGDPWTIIVRNLRSLSTAEKRLDVHRGHPSPNFETVARIDGAWVTTVLQFDTQKPRVCHRWNFQTGEITFWPIPNPRDNHRFTLSPDAKYMAFWHYDHKSPWAGDIYLVDTTTRETVRVRPRHDSDTKKILGLKQQATRLRFSADGKTMLLGCKNGAVLGFTLD